MTDPVKQLEMVWDDVLEILDHYAPEDDEPALSSYNYNHEAWHRAQELRATLDTTIDAVIAKLGEEAAKTEQPDGYTGYDSLTIKEKAIYQTAWERGLRDGKAERQSMREIVEDDSRQRGTMYGSACPKGKVMLEFVGVDKNLRQIYGDSGQESPYSYYPTDFFFLEIWVDGKRFRIDVGNCQENGGGENSRGIHINFPMSAEVKGQCLNALNIVLKPNDIEVDQSKEKL